MSSRNTTSKKELDPLVVANYFLQLDSERVEPDVTQLKLHKIMYFAQANYLGATGSRLFSSHIEASPRGPIVLAICSDFKNSAKKLSLRTIRISWRCPLSSQTIFQNLRWNIYETCGTNSLSILR